MGYQGVGWRGRLLHARISIGLETEKHLYCRAGSSRKARILYYRSALPLSSATAHPTNFHVQRLLLPFQKPSSFVVWLFHGFPSLPIPGTRCLFSRAMALAENFGNLSVAPVNMCVVVSSRFPVRSCVAGITYQGHQQRREPARSTLLFHHSDKSVVRFHLTVAGFLPLSYPPGASVSNIIDWWSLCVYSSPTSHDPIRGDRLSLSRVCCKFNMRSVCLYVSLCVCSVYIVCIMCGL